MVVIQIYDLATLLLVLAGTFLGMFVLVNWLIGKVFQDI